MKRTYYSLLICDPATDTRFRIHTTATRGEAMESARIFKRKGFWISVEKHTSNIIETSKLITSTWNSTVD